jgi:hypothetical protein
MKHPAVLRDPHLYVTATLDAETYALLRKTWDRSPGATILWCGRLIDYNDRAERTVASAIRGEDELHTLALCSAQWQARIDCRAARQEVDLDREAAASAAVTL